MAKRTNSTNRSSKRSTSSPRQIADGWNGIVPGVSQVKDAIAKLGPIEGEDKFANGKWLQFANKNVQLVVLDNDPNTIVKIRVFPGYSDKDLAPANIDAMQKVYGPLEQTDLDEFGVLTYERSGLRAACDFFGNPHPVKWIEFYPINR